MSAKKRKGQSPWASCDYCNVILAQKDVSLHKEKCPVNYESWAHCFITNEQLFTTVNTFNLQDKSFELIPKKIRDDYVLIPCHVLQLCKIPIGDPVSIKPSGDHTHSIPFVKLAWPFQEKTSDFNISISKDDLELNSLHPKSQIVVSKIKQQILPAETVTVIPETELGSSEIQILLTRLKTQKVNKLYYNSNRLLLKHYGNLIKFKILSIFPSSEDGNLALYVTTNETKWIWSDNKSKVEKSQNLLDKIGGLSEIISELKDVMSLVLSGNTVLEGLHLTKGILIHGPPGTGKTLLIQALAEHFTQNIIRIECSKIFSGFVGETERELLLCFDKAKQTSPSVILIDDLDVLCSKQSSSSDYEKRITATLSTLMDKLNNETDGQIIVLGTTSKIHQIDKMLRSPNRFGKEVEIYVPSSPQRFEILSILLRQLNHSLTETEIKSIADSSHGFVGADLASLVSKAALRNFKITQGKENVSFSDFTWALTKVKPSAMKEIMIEVPNVKWNDIGGQDDLKLKLRQSVEWPLKHPEAFKKLGIKAPKGVLMFGPPGCSKTMIAKALATESKLNFISVKGPELFSKWVGESEGAVRKVFRRARQTAPSIIFFDELDAIGGERNSSSGSSANVQERVLAQLLTELDGVESLENVTVIGATNRLDRIDPALIRPGRLDRIIYVPLPDSKTRHEIFSLQLSKSKITEDVLLDELVEKTEGYSGAEIVAVCQEAALKALEENIEAEVVMRKHFLDALVIVVPRTSKSLLEMYDKYIIK